MHAYEAVVVVSPARLCSSHKIARCVRPACCSLLWCCSAAPGQFRAQYAGAVSEAAVCLHIGMGQALEENNIFDILACSPLMGFGWHGQRVYRALDSSKQRALVVWPKHILQCF